MKSHLIILEVQPLIIQLLSPLSGILRYDFHRLPYIRVFGIAFEIRNTALG